MLVQLLLAGVLLSLLFHLFGRTSPQSRTTRAAAGAVKYKCNQCQKSSTIDLVKPIPAATSYATAMARGHRLRQRAAYEEGICTHCSYRNAEVVHELSKQADQGQFTQLHALCALEMLQHTKWNRNSALACAEAELTKLDPAVREIAECLAADAARTGERSSYWEVVAVARALS